MDLALYLTFDADDENEELSLVFNPQDEFVCLTICLGKNEEGEMNPVESVLLSREFIGTLQRTFKRWLDTGEWGPDKNSYDALEAAQAIVIDLKEKDCG